jgi:hypothetical protein
VLEELKGLPGSLFEEVGEAAMVREWILSNLPEGRTSTVLHGDLAVVHELFLHLHWLARVADRKPAAVDTAPSSKPIS